MNRIAVMLAVALVALTSGCREMPMGYGGKIKDSAAAIRRAIALTGLDQVSKKISARRVTIHDDNTPFLAAQFEGKRAWRVTFDEVSFTGKIRCSTMKDRYENQRKFIVLLDAHTGQLLEINTEFTGVRGKMTPAPDASSGEKLLKSSAERYTGLPPMDPKVTFFDVLNETNSIDSPQEAKEINGLYIMYSRIGRPPQPVWMVTFRGAPGIPTIGFGNDDTREHIAPIDDTWRSVTDAMTGQWMYAAEDGG